MDFNWKIGAMDWFGNIVEQIKATLFSKTTSGWAKTMTLLVGVLALVVLVDKTGLFQQGKNQRIAGIAFLTQSIESCSVTPQDKALLMSMRDSLVSQQRLREELSSIFRPLSRVDNLTTITRNNFLFYISVNWWLILLYLVLVVVVFTANLSSRWVSVAIIEVLLFVAFIVTSGILYWIFGLVFARPLWGRWWATYAMVAVVPVVVSFIWVLVQIVHSELLVRYMNKNDNNAESNTMRLYIKTCTMNNVAKQIEKIREHYCKGVNMDFAEMVGEKPNTTSNWINGTRVGISVIEKILEKFPDVRAGWLLEGEEPMLKSEKKETAPAADSEIIAVLREMNEGLKADKARLEKQLDEKDRKLDVKDKKIDEKDAQISELVAKVGDSGNDAISV